MRTAGKAAASNQPDIDTIKQRCDLVANSRLGQIQPHSPARDVVPVALQGPFVGVCGESDPVSGSFQPVA